MIASHPTHPSPQHPQERTMTRDDDTLSSHRTRTNRRPEPAPTTGAIPVADEQQAPASAA